MSAEAARRLKRSRRGLPKRNDRRFRLHAPRTDSGAIYKLHGRRQRPFISIPVAQRAPRAMQRPFPTWVAPSPRRGGRRPGNYERRSMRVVFLGALSAVVLLCVATASFAGLTSAAVPGDANRGAILVAGNGCAGCHGADSKARPSHRSSSASSAGGPRRTSRARS